MLNNGSSITMDKLCRSCMAEISEAKNVFEHCVVGEGFVVADMLMACASVVVNMDDALPKFICVTCEEKLAVAFTFKKQCETTDCTLREMMDQSKREDIEVKPDVDLDDMYNDNDSTDSDVDYVPKSKSKPSLKCSYCEKSFRSKNGYQLHMKRHTKEKLHTCHMCHMQFTKAALYKHMQTAHNVDAEIDGFPCPECGLSFQSAARLSKHIKEHIVEYPAVKMEVDGEADVGDENVEEMHADDQGKFICKFCKKELTTPEGLKIHMRRHTGHNLHCCQICNKSYTKSNHLKRHMTSHKDAPHEVELVNPEPKDKKVMQCEFCDRKFKYKKSFTHHMQSEHGISDDSDTPLSVIMAKGEQKAKEAIEKKEDDSADSDSGNVDNALGHIDSVLDEDVVVLSKPRKMHSCHVCDAKFVRSNYLTRHMILHRSILTHKCDRCDKAFATEEHREKHLKEDHIDKPYTCTVCNKTYTRGEHLIRHLKVHLNPQELDIKCSVCEKVFTRSDHLARHIKLHLQQDKRHICNECGKAFNRLDNLRAHQRIHSGQKDNSKLHLCIYCGKEFNNSSNMIVHMRRHTGERPYKCDQCGKGFPRSHDLKCHERTHSGEKPYMCTLCGKAFNKSNKLLRHTRVHTGERPYVCNICSRAFTQSNDLALHMRRHTGSRPYACGVCPARFIQSGQLKAHRRSTGHWKEIPPDLKGGHRVEPVVPVGEPIPIRFKTHGKKKYEDEDEIVEGAGPGIESNSVNVIEHAAVTVTEHNSVSVIEIVGNVQNVQHQMHHQIQEAITINNISYDSSDLHQTVSDDNVASEIVTKEEIVVQTLEHDIPADLKPEHDQTFQNFATNASTATTYTNSFTYQSY